MEFGEKLQNLRKASNLSQEQLADMLGVSRQSVSKWESGVTYPEMDKLIAMAKLFKCSMDDLVNNDVKDKEIVTTKNKQVNEYVDSLLNYIVDTVNMFFSMKFTTLIKSLIEIFIIGLILFGGATFLIVMLYEFFNSLTINSNLLAMIFMLLFIVFSLFVVGVVFTAFIQIFKIRYLDYYRKALYEEAQVKDLKLEINNDVIENNNKEKKMSFKKDKEPVVIMRDPNGANLKFMEKFMDGLKRAIVIFLVTVLMMCVLPMSVLLIIGLVISVYLISVNFIFVGITFGVIGLLIVCFEALELIYIALTRKKAPARRWAIMFVIALVMSSFGTGLSLIKLKDIKFVENKDRIVEFSEDLDFSDDLLIRAGIDTTFNYIIDETVDNVKISVNYDKDFFGVSLVDRNNGKYIECDYKNYSAYNEINRIIEGLKNNVFYNDYYGYHGAITITANKEHVINLINNLADNNLIYTREISGGYAVDIEDVKRDIDMCNYDSEGIKRCYRVYDDGACEVQVNNQGRISAKNKKCNCNLYRDEYHCHLREEVYE